jgi:hypothetical protein
VPRALLAASFTEKRLAKKLIDLFLFSNILSSA